MGLDDFDSIPPSLRPSGSSDDEDLFDFPEVDASGQPAASAPTPAPTQPPPPATAPAPAPTRAPIITPVPAPAAPEQSTPQIAAPFPSAKPTVRKPALRSVEVRHSVAPAPTPTPAPAPAPAPALAIVDSEGPPADEAPPVPERVRRPKSRPRVLWLVLGVLVLNAAGFALLWASNRSYRSGLEGLRDDLVVTMHDLRRAASETAPSVRAADPIPSNATESTHSPTAPLAPHEETTLLLARQEIDDGEHAQARRRLYRLLAVADRIDAGLRKDIEARAMYLVGDSYRRQADARREARP